MRIFSQFLDKLSGEDSEPKSEKEMVRDCTEMIESFLVDLSVLPEHARIGSQKERIWSIQEGSATITIAIKRNRMNEKLNLEVKSAILKVPQGNLEAFYRRCLDINGYLLECALCTDKDEVWVIAERPLQGLDKEELSSIAINVATSADYIDNQLADEFGAQLIGDEV